MVYFLCVSNDYDDHIGRLRKDVADCWLKHSYFQSRPLGMATDALCGKKIGRFLRQRLGPGRDTGRFRVPLCYFCLERYRAIREGQA